MEGLIFYLLVFLTGVAGSFIGTISAGAGIVVFSGLTLLGVPPQIALATENFGSLGFRLGSLYNYIKHKKIVWSLILPLSILGCLGATIGASILVRIDRELLNKIIGLVLLILLPLMFMGKNVGIVQKTVSKTRRKFTHFWYFLVQAWAGFFAPGSGFLELFVMTKGYGLTILQVKGTNKIPALIADSSAFIVFFLASLIDFKIGLFLICGTLLGSYIGSHVAIKKGDVWIKPLMIIAIIIVSLKMIFF